jgi:spore coat protein A
MTIRTIRSSPTKLGIIAVLAALALVVSGLCSPALASNLVPQTPLPGKSFTKYLDPLPFFGPGGAVPRVTGTVVPGLQSIDVTYNEFQQSGDLQPLPSNFMYGGNFPNPPITPNTAITGTLVWGYDVGGTLPLWPGVTVEATVGTPTRVTYTNNLPSAAPYSILQKYVTVDQTLHWANPFNLAPGDPNRFNPYAGPVPVVPHLHGGITPSAYDGGPDQWFTNGSAPGTFSTHGPGYRTIFGTAADNQCIYQYPNDQEPATLWFHEHTLGATRTNVFSGLAAYYFLRGYNDDGVPGANKLPASDSGTNTAREIEIAIQDRSFDTQGQLFFPDVGLNPTIHPFWVPEFVGDVITVNGKVWPTLTVDPVRYRFRFLEGSNARFYNLSFQATTGPQGAKKPLPSFWVIGTDGGFLDTPVNTPTLLFAPGERYDTIVDFSAFAGQTFLIVNDARAPYPGGAPASPSTVGQIMQIVVNPQTNPPFVDSSYNPDPATGGGGPIRNAAGDGLPINLPPIVRLASNGQLAVNPADNTKKVTPTRVRQLTLNEVIGKGGPLEILVNNTKWNGVRPDGSVNADAKAYTLTTGNGGNDATNYLTELPQNGSTEVWEIINLTADSHPIHIHEFQFQLLNRQAFTMNGSKGYLAAYNAAFQGGVFTPAYGPPFAYKKTNLAGTQEFETLTRTDGSTVSAPIIGGNPNIVPFLSGPVILPRPYEDGWKDTFIMNPGEVTRVVVRWTPQNIPVGGETPGTNQFTTFDPTNFGNPPGGVILDNPADVANPQGPGYVWHCHIIDHEDNEMMRPYIPVSNPDNNKD